ncbi:hypothetical protein C5Y96_03145 [Blastopirellula marina]|uniref:Uncharacterized protein n=1 Tax=Blastopirellula marina TaxID=124 RepID=A0A2S8G353_9BACT|nr:MULTISPECIES: hypothetical protein [Pirellulaceae]PQO38882.1 hypothetical protein C5Y96_03145 [Blastopirellula marina]RCS55190.1 hypothetical protein DTL36_03150 [Bremerella cremea]
MPVLSLKIADGAPSLKPYWRWDAARDEVASEGRRIDYEDAGIARLVQYLEQTPERTDAVLDEARRIFEEDGLARAELEARVVANQPPAKIAKLCGLNIDVVNAYEEYFFVARRYLRACDWLTCNVFGGVPGRGHENHELRQVWAKLAYQGGRIILQKMIDVYRQASRGMDICLLDVYLQDDKDIELPIQMEIAMQVIPTSREHDWFSLDLAYYWRKMEACRDEGTRATMKVKMQQAVVRYARELLKGKQPKWKRLSIPKKKPQPAQRRKS